MFSSRNLEEPFDLNFWSEIFEEAEYISSIMIKEKLLIYGSKKNDDNSFSYFYFTQPLTQKFVIKTNEILKLNIGSKSKLISKPRFGFVRDENYNLIPTNSSLNINNIDYIPFNTTFLSNQETLKFIFDFKVEITFQIIILKSEIFDRKQGYITNFSFKKKPKSSFNINSLRKLKGNGCKEDQKRIDETGGCIKKEEPCPYTHPFYNESNSLCVSECRGDTLYQGNNCVYNCTFGFYRKEKICKARTEIISKVEVKDKKVIIKTDKNFDFCDHQIKDLLRLYNDQNGTLEVYSSEFNFTFFSKKDQIELLTDCEKLLREKGIVRENTTLIHCQVSRKDSEWCNSAATQVEYRLYDKKNNTIDMTLCKKMRFNITLPIDTKTPGLNLEIAKKLQEEQGVNIFDSKDPFFNDRCISYSHNGKDLTLKNRQSDVFSKVSLCGDGCTVQQLNYTKSEVSCNCSQATQTKKKDEDEDDELFFDVSEITETTNIELFLCYKVPFTKVGRLKTSVGHWFIFILFIIVIVNSIIFWKIHFPKLEDTVFKSLSNPPKSKTLSVIEESSEESRRALKIEKYTDLRQKRIEKPKEIEEEDNYIDNELNEMEYKEALDGENRSFFQYFFNILSQKDIFMCAILYRSHFFPISLELILVCFSIGTFLFITGMLFTEDYITNRYYSTEKVNFSYIIMNELSRSVYASIISIIITNIANLSFSVSIDIKKAFKEEIKERKVQKVSFYYLKLKQRALIVTMIVFICLIIYWYFLTIFCGLYRNTQISLLESTGITFIFFVFIEIFISFTIASLRYIGLRGKMSFIFQISLFLYHSF